MKAFSVFTNPKKKNSVTVDVLTPSVYYRKCANKIKFLKFAILFSLIIFILYGITFHGNEITVENFRYMMKYLDFSSANTVVGEKEITYDHDEKARFELMRDNVVVVDGGGVAIYDLTGQRSLSTKFTFTNPAVAVSDRFVFAYDIGVGSNTLKIFNVYSEIKSYKYDFPIFGVSVNDNGAYCVITSEHGFVSGFIAYDSSNRFIFRKSYADRYVVSVDISEGGKDFYSLVVNAVDGDFVSEALHYDMNGEEAVHSVKYLGEYPVKIFNTKEGNVYVLTDKALRFYNGSFELLSEIKFDKETPKRYFFDDGYVAMTLSTQIVGNSTRLMVFDSSGNTILDNYFDGDVTRVRMTDDALLLMMKGKLSVMNLKTGEMKNIELDLKYTDFHISSGGVVFVSATGSKYMEMDNILNNESTLQESKIEREE